MKPNDRVHHGYYGLGTITTKAPSSGLPGLDKWWVDFDQHAIPREIYEKDLNATDEPQVKKIKRL